MKMPTTLSLMKTIAVFRLADSLMPITRTVVIARIARIANRLKSAVTCGSPADTVPDGSEASGNHRSWKKTSTVPGVAVKPRRQMRCATAAKGLLKYLRPAGGHRSRAEAVLQPRSQPMIQATNSPSVA